MAKENEQQARVSLNGEEVWTGDWFKVWKTVLNLTAENRDKLATIEVKLLG